MGNGRCLLPPHAPGRLVSGHPRIRYVFVVAESAADHVAPVFPVFLSDQANLMDSFHFSLEVEGGKERPFVKCLNNGVQNMT